MRCITKTKGDSTCTRRAEKEPLKSYNVMMELVSTTNDTDFLKNNKLHSNTHTM